MRNKEQIEQIRSMTERELLAFLRQSEKLRIDNKFYREKYLKIKNEYDDLLFKKETQPDLFKLKQNIAGFNKLNTWTDRIVYIIKTENRFLTSINIFEIAYKYNKGVATIWNYPLGTLRQNIHLAVHYGRIKSISFRGRKEHFYGLPSFFDANGIVKQEYGSDFL